MALDRRPGPSAPGSVSGDRLWPALNNVLRVVFEVQRIRGKLREWFSMVDDPAKVRTAQTLASVIRKIEFLSGEHPDALQSVVAPFDSRAVAGLSQRLAGIPGLSATGSLGGSVHQRVRQRIRRLVSIPQILSRLVAADRLETRRRLFSNSARRLSTETCSCPTSTCMRRASTHARDARP